MSSTDALWPVLGGFFAGPLNTRIKRGLTGIYQSSRSVLGQEEKPAVLKAKDSRAGTLNAEATIQDISSLYANWQAASDNTMHLYVDTVRGLFCMHLASGVVVQGMPWKEPMVPRKIKDSLESVPSKSAQVTQAILRRFQLNCLINMLLKDLRLIIKQWPKARDEIPMCMTRLLNILKPINTGDVTNEENIMQAMFDPSNEIARTQDLNQLNTFMTNKPPALKTQLFFTQAAPPESKQVQVAMQMGMVFSAIFSQGLMLFIQPSEENKEWMADLPLSLPQDGCKWLLTGRIRYTIIM